MTEEGTAAIIIGASHFKSEDLTPSESFARSAREIRRYLVNKKGLNLDIDDVLFLFDSDGGPEQQNIAINEFLSGAAERFGGSIRNLILFYTGHGILADDADYFLALRKTEPEHLEVSAYSWNALCKTITSRAREAKHFVILDSCFAGRAARTGFVRMGDEDQLPLVRKQQLEHFPQKGFALLCASGEANFALAKAGEDYTMFSDGLIAALTKGDGSRESMLNLEDLQAMAADYIYKKYATDAVQPELHAPGQSNGPITKVGLFPNFARKPSAALERLDRFEGIANDVVETLKSMEQTNATKFDGLNQSILGMAPLLTGLQDGISALSLKVDAIGTSPTKPGVPERDPIGEPLINMVYRLNAVRGVGIAILLLSAVAAAVLGYLGYSKVEPWSVGPTFTALLTAAGLAVALLLGTLVASQVTPEIDLEGLTESERRFLGARANMRYLRLFYVVPTERLFVILAVLVLIAGGVAAVVDWPSLLPSAPAVPSEA